VRLRGRLSLRLKGGKKAVGGADGDLPWDLAEVVLGYERVHRTQLRRLDHVVDLDVSRLLLVGHLLEPRREVLGFNTDEADREDLPRILQANAAEHPRGNAKALVGLPSGLEVAILAAARRSPVLGRPPPLAAFGLRLDIA
jgi:hypothetical protein